jgi:hypothetical protein
MYGPDRLVGELRELGFPRIELVNVSDGNKFAIIYNYEIMLGQFAGRVIDLGIPATSDFPRTVGSAIHVRAIPQLFEKQNVPNVRNIIDSPLGNEWRYWSKNFGWAEERSARRLISQINEVFKNA